MNYPLSSAISAYMTKEKLLSGSIPPKVLTALKQMRKACTHTVTKEELDLTEFGTALRQLRLDSEISLRGMAKLIGLSPPFLSDCELGNRRLSLKHQIKFVTECMK